MLTRLDDHTLKLPLAIDVTKQVILRALQEQVATQIDPDSLAFDQEGIVWDDGYIVLDVSFHDRQGFGRGRVFVQPCTSDDLDLCFMTDVKYLGHLPSAGAS